jgi:hypothetical protein
MVSEVAYVWPSTVSYMLYIEARIIYLYTNLNFKVSSKWTLVNILMNLQVP